jgi:hypothetical protein
MLITNMSSHSFATMHPLPRVSPHMDIHYKQWKIPAGVSFRIALIIGLVDDDLDCSWNVSLLHAHRRRGIL